MSDFIDDFESRVSVEDLVDVCFQTLGFVITGDKAKSDFYDEVKQLIPDEDSEDKWCDVLIKFGAEQEHLYNISDFISTLQEV